MLLPIPTDNAQTHQDAVAFPLDFRLGWWSRVLATLDDACVHLCPSLVSHLATLKCHTSLVIGNAMGTLWSDVLPMEAQLRVADLVVEEGCFGLLRCSLQLLSACEGLILSCTSAASILPALCQFMQHMLSTSATQGVSIIATVDKVFAAPRPEWLPLMRTLLVKNACLQALFCIPRVPPM